MCSRDVLTPAQRTLCMRAVRSEGTGPEMRVRRLLHKQGFRYALHKKDLPGRPDLAFVARRKAIFVHGCFWHKHSCKAGRKIPRTNADYWALKRSRTVARDRAAVQKLKDAGWSVLVIWECQTHAEMLPRLMRFLKADAPEALNTAKKHREVGRRKAVLTQGRPALTLNA